MSYVCHRVILCGCMFRVWMIILFLNVMPAVQGGAVLSIERGSEVLQVAFFLKQLHGAQRCYSAQELEELAVYEAICHFAFYLYGRRFVVITDHKCLVSLRTGHQENRRIYGWSLKLVELDFEMR